MKKKGEFLPMESHLTGPVRLICQL